jgi:thioredoxin-dependent peroxiredoxin
MDLFGLILLANVGCAASPASAVPEPLSAASTTTRATAFSSEPIPGQPAPDFVAVSHDGSNVALSSLRGRTVILFFYTRDETPKAIREAVDFRMASKDLKDKGIVIVGVSTDDAETHKKFADRLGLPFRLVADPEGVVARAYGVPAEYGVMDRRTFVIGPDGAIERVYRNIDVETHVAQVVADIGRT